MSKNQILKAILLSSLFVSVAFSICLKPQEPDGKCTSCVAVQVLIGGSCYPKIVGCFKYIAGPKCTQCQFGYVLSNGRCIRSAVFFNITDLTPAPVVITNNQSLTIQQITSKLGEQYSYDFTTSHEYFLSKYSSQIGKGNIRDVQKLITKNGTVFVVLYQGQSLNVYEAISKVGEPYKVEEWSFVNIISQKRDPVSADITIRKSLGDSLKGFIIFQVRQQGEAYIFDYMNQNKITRVTINKNQVQPPNNAESKMNTKFLNLSDLAFQRLSLKFPLYRNSKIVDVKQFNKYKVVILDQGVTFSYKFQDFIFTINDPVNIPQVSAFPQFSSIKTVAGGFSQFTNFNDSRFLSAIRLVKSQFSQVSDTQIFQVQSQIVSGIRFFVRLRKPITFDSYQFLIWVPLSGVAQLIEGRKNGALIYLKDYNYNTDPIFLNNFNIVQVESKVSNIPPISSVSFKLVGAKRYYRVNFSDTQYSQFEYDTSTNKGKLISYNVDGQNILETLAGNLKGAIERSPELLLSFIRQKNPTITQAVIQSIQLKAPTYILSILTNSGIYKAEILDKGGQLLLNQFTQTSTSNCSQLDMTVSLNKQKIALSDNYFRQNYPIAGFQIKLVQVSVRGSAIITRFLYANSQQKQIEIYTQELGGSLNILKAAFLNFGYGLLPFNRQSSWYSKFSSSFNRTNITTAKDPLLIQSNGTFIHFYIDDGKSTFQITYELSNDKINTQVLGTRSYLLVPEGFSLQNLLIPGIPSVSQTARLNLITQQATKRNPTLLSNAQIVFASKQNNNYLIMYKNSLGYQRLDASVSGDLVTVGKLVITTYKDGDFSNCKRFDATGKCLSCSDSQSEYQGFCFKKLQGCKVQVGKICAKCETDFVKSSPGQLCFKQCSNFFK